MPSSMDVSGRKPMSRVRSPTSAKVSVTSPGCIGNISFTAVRPNSFSNSATSCGNAIQEARYYTGNVIDIGEVAAHLAMVKKPDRPAFNDRPGKQENCHIGPSPWPVDGEEPQAGDRKPVEVAVAMSHQLVGLFGRGVETNGMIGLVIDRKWQLGVVAIDR